MYRPHDRVNYFITSCHDNTKLWLVLRKYLQNIKKKHAIHFFLDQGQYTNDHLCF